MSNIDISKFVNSYEFDYTLPGSNEVIFFKPITTGQLKKLLPYENENNPMLIETLLDKLITDCVVSEGFDIKNLYLEDRFALLVEIRKKSKGEDYSFIYNCPKCKHKSPITLDLNNIKLIKKNNETPVFKINDQLSCDMNQITRGEQLEIYDIINAQGIENDNLKIAQIATYTYAMAMRTFHTPEGDTEVPIEQKVSIIDNVLNDEQYKEMIDWFVKNSFGLDFTFEFKCSKEECNNTETLAIPLNNFFV